MLVKVILIVFGCVFLGVVDSKKSAVIKNARRRGKPAVNPAGIIPGTGNLQFRKLKTKDAGGVKIAKFQQTYNGVPVVGAEINARVNENGEIIGNLIGDYEETDNVDTTINTKLKQAERILKGHWNHTDKSVLKFREDAAELQNKIEDGILRAVWYISYYVEYKKNAGEREVPRTIPAWIEGWVAASDGHIVESYNRIARATITTNGVVGNSRVGDTLVAIEVNDLAGGNCAFVDDVLRVKSVNLNRGFSLPTDGGTTFTCDDNNDTNWDLFIRTGGYSPRNEAFLYAQNLVKMYREQIGSDPHNPSSSHPGYYLQQLVHYARRYENAFFNGYYFVYGDGRTMLYPLTSQDMVCHEIGHGITYWHGGDMAYSDQPGGINEAYSDMTGEACEFYNQTKINLIMGDELIRLTATYHNGEGLRDMCDPTRWSSLDHFDDYADGLNVHSTSGIYNKAFCLLSKSTGWDILKAWKLMTFANLRYWTVRVTMPCGVCGVEMAASDMSEDLTPIQAAFNAVGLSCSACI